MIYYFVIAYLCTFVQCASLLSSKSVPNFSVGRPVGTVTAHAITEASGLAASRIHANVLYTHNDKGDRSRIFAIDATNGHLLAEFEIDNAANHDWEDIATGPCPSSATRHCIFIGDIGDGNTHQKVIYVVEEPTVIGDSTLYLDQKLSYKWAPSDAETLMVDQSGNVYLISKEQGGRSLIGIIPNNAFSRTGTYTIVNTSSLNIPITTHHDPVGGDISPDGTEVLVRTHEDIYYWKVANGDYLQTLSQVVGEPVTAHEEHQGESVAWDIHGSGYYTVSEGHNEHLYYYTRL